MYYHKYLKYKQKYLEARNQQMGGEKPNNHQSVAEAINRFGEYWETKQYKQTRADNLITEILAQSPAEENVWDKRYDSIKLVLYGEVYRIKANFSKNEKFYNAEEKMGFMNSLREWENAINILISEKQEKERQEK